MKTCGLILLLASVAVAQTTRPVTVVSPEVHPDRTVTFRIRAPKAAEVTLTGDWIVVGKEPHLVRDEQGVWSITVGPLEPGSAIYSFTVDGTAMADPVNPRIKLRAQTSASFVDVPGDGTELFVPRDVPHGVVAINWQKSKVLDGQTRQFRVYTPPGYDQNPTARYPVLYLLHGSNDTAAGWTDAGQANIILDNLIAEKKVVPMIVVMPWGHAVPYGQPNNDPTFERYLLQDVMPTAEKNYRVAPGRENRAIFGLSMGGGQALSIGFGHVDLFSAIAGFSAAIPRNFETQFKSIVDDPNGTNANLKLVWIGAGKQEPAFAGCQRFSQMLTSHGIKNTFFATDGLHNFTLWRKCLIETAPLLFH